MTESGSVDPDATLKERWASTLGTLGSSGALDPSTTYRRTQQRLVRSNGPASPGQTLPARRHDYEILGEIGRGGMGIVHRARQVALGREVALKQSLADGMPESQMVSEALVTATLDHPNIVPIHEICRGSDDRVCISMKLVSGLTWKRLLKPTAGDLRADFDRHLEILMAVCNAMAFAHEKGVLHRDLKPENVMVGDFGEVYVMDWGLAMAIPPPDGAYATGESAPVGTPSYMAPELALGDVSSQGPWTDVYLLGAILHEILVGGPPHRGRDLMVVLVAAMRSAPAQYPEGVDRELGEICRRAMSAEPRHRYQSVREFQQAVRDYLGHRESIRIARTADDKVQRGALQVEPSRLDLTSVYMDLADAISRYQRSLELWPENRASQVGLRHARMKLAQVAMAAGDLALAETQLKDIPATDPGRRELADAIRGRVQAQSNELVRHRRTGVLVWAAVAVVVAVLALAFLSLFISLGAK